MRLFFAIYTFSVIVSSVVCYRVKRVFASSGLTDGLFWDSRTHQLIFVDTYDHKICSLHTLQNNTVFCARLGNSLVSFGVPVQKHRKISNQFVVGATNDILLIKWDGKTNVEDTPTKKLASADKGVKGNRINYGTVSPSNRLWFGTINFINGSAFSLNMASVYSLDSHLHLETQISPVSFSSGLVWSTKNDKLYFVDSLTYTIVAYDYNFKRGTVANRKVIFELNANHIPGIPGRLAIDTDGNLWVPIFEGSRVIQINPKTKKLIGSVKIPARKVGACTFGGPNLDILYITTVGYGFSNTTELTPVDDAEGGSIYGVTGLSVKGQRAQPFKLNIRL